MPAVHGPEDGERDAEGEVNCQVVGFVLAGDAYRTLAQQLAEAGVDGKDLFVSYFENGPEDWSFADGRAQYIEGDLPIPGR
ncbi:tautomerase family protein [Streptomyces sp. NPDC005349]|uniref:tautomerase family protein n=1 Tax=Streptomyces sp. NPDC005349 TaxID=3157037 RepID=UPI0033A362E0